MKPFKTTSIILGLVLILAQSTTSVFAANEIKNIQNIVDDWLWFDDEGDIRESSLTQGKNIVTNGNKTTYYNLYGDAIMEREGDILSVNLSTDKSGNVTAFARAVMVQGPDGEYIRQLGRYEIVNGKARLLFSYSGNNQTSYTYDDAGNITGTTYIYKDNDGNITYSSTTTQTYHENGTRSGYSSHATYADGRTYDYQQTYNSDGKVTSYNNTQTDANGNTTYSNEATYTYDDAGNRTGYTYRNSDANGLKYLGEATYTFDENGNQTGYTNTNRNANGSVRSSSEQTVVYDENGKRISSESVSTSGGNTYRSEQSYTYDDNGNQTGYVSVNKHGNGTVRSSYEQAYNYDDAGNRTGYSYTSKDANGNVTHSAENSLTYDENGNQTGSSYVSKDKNGNITYAYENTSTYNDEGQRTGYTYVRKGANGAVVNSTEQTYTYNEEEGTTTYISVYKDANGNITSQSEGTYTTNYNYYGSSDASGSGYSSSYVRKDADGNVISVSNYNSSADWNISSSGSASFTDGEVSSFYGDSTNYTSYNDDGSYSKTTIASQTSGVGGGNTVDGTWSKSLSSSIESLNAESFSSNGDYLGYKKTDVEYDANGTLTGSTIGNYTGEKGSETYAGKTQFSNYTYNEDGQVLGYTETEYDTDDNQTSQTIISNITYDAYGRKVSWNYQTSDANGNIIDSGTHTQ